MPLKWILFTCILNFFFILTGAQETENNFAVFDWSFSFFKSEPTDLDHIRGGVASFYAENSNKGLACISFRGATSVKFEQFRLNDRVGLGAGIRFTQFVQNTGKWDMITEGANYFYRSVERKGVQARIRHKWSYTSFFRVTAIMTLII